jgi:myo-inositol-1(or 4)-monophosphatase
MPTQSALISIMIRAARRAARGLLRDFGEVEQLQVSRKGPADFVSNADIKAEKTLREELERARPDFGLLMEESGAAKSGDGRHRFIVDPLDGTTNFLHGLPHFAISIGAERDGELIAGVVYEPTRDEMFWAEKGQGAHLNDRRLRVSAREQLRDALIATGIPFMGKGNDPGHRAYLAQMGAVMGQVAGIRRWGTASLDLAYVAAGRFDGFWEMHLSPWDMAAGIVLVREAGGFVAEVDGGSKMLESGNILAANDRLHAPLGQILRQAKPA